MSDKVYIVTVERTVWEQYVLNDVQAESQEAARKFALEDMRKNAAHPATTAVQEDYDVLELKVQSVVLYIDHLRGEIADLEARVAHNEQMGFHYVAGRHKATLEKLQDELAQWEAQERADAEFALKAQEAKDAQG